jgi:hypothetical protein
MCPCLPTLVGEEKEGQRCCCTPPISLDVAFFDGLSLRWHHGTQVERLNGWPDLTKKAVPAERLTELVLFDPKRAKRWEERIRSEEGERREGERRKNGELVVLRESVLNNLLRERAWRDKDASLERGVGDFKLHAREG